MNRPEAQHQLLLFRPGTDDAAHPDFAPALAQINRDPELEQWFEKHCACQQSLRNKLRQIPIPKDLKENILAARKIVRPAHAWWQHTGVLAAAAALVLLAVVSFLWLPQSRAHSFEHFRSRMVRNAIRLYGMDIVTNKMELVRNYIATHGAPADYLVPKRLESLSLTGGGVLRWRNHPVSMVCFDRGDQQMLFLFVVEREQVSDPPPQTPALAKVNRLRTAGWTEGDHTYLLAGPAEGDPLERYLAN